MIRQEVRPLAAVIAVLLALAPIAAAQDAQKVVEIVFQGNSTVSDAFLLRHIKLAKDAPYDRDVENEDVKRLYKLGYFRNIEVKREGVPGGLRIIFVLDESKTIGTIVLIGFEEIDEEEVKSALRLKEGRPYDAFLEKQDRQTIERMYQAEGYQFAHVRVKADPKAPKDKINLRFYVTEGPKIGLARISFTGNNSYTEKQLKATMQLEENGWLWFLRERFDEELLDEDLAHLRQFYRDSGFQDVEIALSNVRYTPNKRDMEIEVHVEEGPRYRVGTIEITGHKLFSTKEITDRLQLRSGEFFDRRKQFEDARRIRVMYGDAARMDIRVVPAQHITLDNHLIHIQFQIDEGRRIFIDRVDIEGNDTTRDDVIRRELELFPGDPFNGAKGRRSRENLLSLSYIESVGFEVRKSQSGDPNLRDILVKVKEGNPRSLIFAAGVTSNVGLVGEINFTHRNFDITRLPTSWDDLVNGDAFMGAGQSLTIQFQPGTERNQFRIAFREPYLGGSPYSLDVDLRATFRERETYDDDRLVAEFTVGRRLLGRDLLGELGLRLESIDIDADSDAPPDVLDVDGGNSQISLIGGLAYDKRNNVLLPSKGYRLGGQLQLSGGDHSYVKNDYRASYYRTITKSKDGRPHILSTRARLGVAGGDVPVYDRYFAGGHGSVRGFEFRTISPKQEGEPVGGELIGLLGVEYSAPIFGEVLRGILFLDLGSVESGVRGSVGFGFRLRIPGLGPVPVALDFGFPFLTKKDDEKRIFSFALGRSF